MALWNKRNLDRPSSAKVKVVTTDIKPEICGLVITCNNMLSYFYSMKRFETAAAMLSRVSNVWKLRMRNIAGFQKMRRLYQTLRRIKSMNISWEILNFSSSLPDVSFIPTEVELPVCSNLHYLLVRLQGLVKLLMHAVYLAKEIARYTLKQIADGFLFHQTSFVLALMGELWVLLRTTCRQVDQFYGELHTALAILPKDSPRWIPKGYNLPSSVADWLGKEYAEEIIRNTEADSSLDISDDPNLFSLLSPQANDEEDVLEQIADIAATAAKKEQQSYEPTVMSALPKMMLLQALGADTGEVVESLPPAVTAGSSNVSVATKFSTADLAHIRSKFHVKQFIEEERAKRAQNGTKAITSKVSEANFVKFNKSLMNDFKRLSSADFVNSFKKRFLELIDK